MKTKKITGRIATIALAILLLLTALVSCGGKQATPTLSFDKEHILNSVGSGEAGKYGLSYSDMSKVAEVISAAFSAQFDAREALVAANRGYDITEGIKEGIDYSKDMGLNLDAAKKVIKKANDTSSAAGKVAFTDAELNAEGTGILNKLNAADVQLIIDSFRTSVDVQKGGFWRYR